ncbi:MAG: hypothetical protein ABR548_06790 [Actinomycetota bacterium]
MNFSRRESLLTRLRIGVVLVTTVMVSIFAGSPRHAIADPIYLQASVAEVSFSEDILLGPDGAQARATLLALRDTSGAANLYVRICPEFHQCTDYSTSLTASEFIISNGAAYINVNVPDLGLVKVSNGGMGLQGGNLCPTLDEGAFVYIFSTEIPSRIHNGGDGYGDVIGPWFVFGGRCGMAGMNANVLVVS